MRTIVHLSDLHFGRVDHAILEPLIESVITARPHLVVISGDLTQRARTAEFQAARAFLDRLPQPQMVVPGNHDIPMHNPLTRFVQPLKKFRSYITEDLEPFFADEEMAVVGLNTARSLTIKDGRINDRQIMRTHERLQEVFAACGVDAFLAGHIHVIYAGQTAERYQIDGHSALVIQAGTATSTRVRGESNSFNVITIDLPNILVARHTWDAASGQFAVTADERFTRGAEAWLPA
jgi:3',5'-cyclic AMP phosphodiesterase CpdA